MNTENNRLIFLIGFSGSGKTSVGAEIANKLSCKHLDMNEEIVGAKNMPIRKIIMLYGEHEFRNYEAKMLDELCDNPPEKQTIVSCSDSIVFDDENISRLKEFPTFFLNDDANAMFDRIKNREDNISAFWNEDDDAIKREKFLSFYTSRLSLYERAASNVISAEGKSISAISDEIIGLIKPA